MNSEADHQLPPPHRHSGQAPRMAAKPRTRVRTLERDVFVVCCTKTGTADRGGNTPPRSTRLILALIGETRPFSGARYFYVESVTDGLSPGEFLMNHMCMIAALVTWELRNCVVRMANWGKMGEVFRREPATQPTVNRRSPLCRSRRPGESSVISCTFLPGRSSQTETGNVRLPNRRQTSHFLLPSR